MGHKCHPHDIPGAKTVVYQPTYDHGNRESKEPHRVDETQFLGREIELLAELWQDTCPDGKSEGSCDEGKTTTVEKCAFVNVVSHKREIVDSD